MDDNDDYSNDDEENRTHQDPIIGKVFFSKYKAIKKLGEGSFGKVYKAEYNGENYAIKMEHKSKEQGLLELEATIMNYLKGPNIPEFKSFGYSGEYNILVMQLLGKSLEDLFNKLQKFSVKTCSLLIYQMISILQYIHDKHIIHRDIKPDKFIDDNCKGPKRYSDSFIFPHQFNEEQHPVTNNSGSTSFKYKLSDIFNIFTYPFSSSEEKNNSTKFEDIKRQKFVGTAEYMAPEIINSKKTGFYTDMWSVMCILYLCFTGVTPFSDKTEYLIFQNITHVKYNEDKINLIPEEARDLIKSFFKSEPRERIGYKNEKEFDFNKIKSHPFFLLKEEKENFNINITHIKQSLMFKCSYFRKLLEKKNKNYMNNLSNVQSSNKINDNISDYSNNSNNKDKTENDKEKESIRRRKIKKGY